MNNTNLLLNKDVFSKFELLIILNKLLDFLLSILLYFIKLLEVFLKLFVKKIWIVLIGGYQILEFFYGAEF